MYQYQTSVYLFIFGIEVMQLFININLYLEGQDKKNSLTNWI